MTDADIMELASMLTRAFALKLSVDVEKAAISVGAKTEVTMQYRAAVFEKFLTGELNEPDLCGARSEHGSSGAVRESTLAGWSDPSCR
jgi:hypothetical protein